MIEKMKEIKGIGDIHTHHFISRYVPDSLFKNQTKHEEKKLRLFASIRFLFPRSKRLFLKSLTFTDVNQIREMHLQEMNAAGIGYSIPLMVDYTMSSPLSEKEKLSRYPVTMEETALSCAKNPFRFFLFHYFDPRYGVDKDRIIGKRDIKLRLGTDIKKFKNTTAAIRLLLRAYYEFGVIGIKLYPAHGYHPISEENVNEDNLIQVKQFELDSVERERVRDNLDFLYLFCHQNSLPILTHCGPEGSFNLVVPDELKGRHVWNFTNPLNFDKVVKRIKKKNNGKCNLRICLAHYGGKTHHLELGEISRKWRNDILHLIKTYKGVFYTDNSYDIKTFLSEEIEDKRRRLEMLKENVEELRKNLQNPDYGDYILFGTDWPMGLAFYTLSEYLKVYRDAFQGEMELYQKYASENSAAFLFGDKRTIPENHIAFLRTLYGPSIPLQSWIHIQKRPSGKLIYSLRLAGDRSGAAAQAKSME